MQIIIRAVWNDTVIAESDRTIVVEGNHYFPPADVNKEYLAETESRTQCPWKGEAHYFNIVVGDEINRTAAWSYLQPKEKAVHISNYYAFWKGVSVEI